MKVLLVNGSAHKEGCTFTALSEVAKALNENDIETEFFQLENLELRDCCGCQACRKLGKCVFNDGMVNEFIEKAKLADGFVFGTPVYYGSANATLIAFLTRLFYSTSFDKTMKVGASAIVARRGGISSTYDEINKFFTIIIYFTII